MVQDQFKPSVAAPQGQSPLRDFWAVLDSYEADSREYTNDDGTTRRSMAIVFKHKDLEVLEATEPYPFPIAEIRINYSPPDKSRGGTRWEAFSGSLRRINPVDPDIDLLVGKRQRWTMQPATLRVQDPDTKVWGEAQQDCWQVTEVEGVQGPEDLTPTIIQMANGKSEKEFYQVLLTDSRITARPDLISSITARQLLPALLASGRLERDAEGVLHAKQVEAQA